MLIRSGTLDQQTAYTPPMSIWSPELEAMVNIQDLLGYVQLAILRSAGSNQGSHTPAARPKTAVDRLNVRVREAQHNDLVARLARLRAEADEAIAAGRLPEEVEMETIPGTGAVE